LFFAAAGTAENALFPAIASPVAASVVLFMKSLRLILFFFMSGLSWSIF